MTLTQITEKGIKDGEIVNADINASAAIAKSKLASLDIVNGDINASAAIAKSKLASLNIVNADVNSSAAIAKEKLEDFVTGNSNNRLLTATGNTNSLTGESSFTYNGNGGLDMEGTAAAFFQIKTPDSTDGGVYFRTGTTNAGAISYLHNSTLADGVMNFRSGGTNKMVIKGNGRVGINSTNPAGKFHVVDTYHFLVTGGNSTTGMKIGNYDGTNYGVLTTRGSRLRFDIGDTNKLDLQSTGQINHLGPLIFTKNDQPNPYNSSLAVNEGALQIRGDLGGGNYWGWRERATAAASVSNANAIKVLPSINDFQYPNDSDGLLIASTSKIGFAASSESPQYANGVQMLFDSDGLALGSGNAFSHEHSSINSANTNVVIRTNGNIQFKNGAGIDFYNYGTGTNIDSNKLDDYEEGTFTPLLSDNLSSGTANSYQNQSGHYTKIGNIVHIIGGIRANDISNLTSSNTLCLRGLPFAASNVTTGSGEPDMLHIPFMNNLTNVDRGLVYGRVENGVSACNIGFPTTTVQSGGNLSVSQINSGGNATFFSFSATYRTGG